MLLALLVAPSLANAASWWNQDWQYRKEVGFDLTAQGADVQGSPSDVPVLVRLSIANFGFFADVKPDGSDFRVIGSDDKTPLKFHFERFDAQNQMAFLWVRVPRLTGGAKSDRIYLYYGNPKAPGGADAPGTYDNDTALALHFSDPQGLPQDVSAYKNNPTASTAAASAASLSGGGVTFTGRESITIPASATLRVVPAGGATISLWFKVAGAQKQATLLSFSDGGKEVAVGIDGLRAFARVTGVSGTALVQQAASDLSVDQWHHLAAIVTAGNVALYVDGTSVASANAAPAETGGTISIGSGYVGEVDEVLVSKVARSGDWVKAVARGVGPDAPLVLFGADGQREGGQSSYFVTIAKNLTVDGWVVIGICFAMLILAIFVMGAKAIFLGSIERANRNFLTEFRRLQDDALALDKNPTTYDEEAENSASAVDALVAGKADYTASTLFTIYHHGVIEINKRIARATGGKRAAVLSAQSIEAVRAVMDSTLVRQQLRLSKQMVLLTIAISGGPFLGLLGTVIGVMITFAAIALSGDVNVNAIAPGTAAALAATVAGLSVAIPSLFGYNWLNTRIKSINVENRVFLDEFVARVAEQYS
jgi:biopolymer transport protein ExbB